MAVIVPVQEGRGGQTVSNGLGFLETSESRVNQLALNSSHMLNWMGTHTLQYGYQFEDIDYDDIRRYTGPTFQIPDRPEFGEAAGRTQFGATLTRTHLNASDLSSPIVLRITRGDYSNPAVSTMTRYHSGFLQDSWVLGRRITVKPGLRYEYQSMAGNASRYTFTPNWAPRVGVIFDPFGNRRSKIFANWGRFFEKIPLDIAVRSFSFESSVRGALYRDLTPPDLSPANYVPGGRITPSGGPSFLTLVAGGTKAQYQDEAVGGFETDLGDGTFFSTRFIYRHLRRVLEDVSGINVTQNEAGVEQQYVVANPSASLDIFRNALPCAPRSAGCDPSTGFTAGGGQLVSDGTPDGFPNPTRIYRALEFVLAKRLATNWQFYGNYRLSKLHGNYEGLFRNDNGQQDPNITSLFDFTNTDNRLADQFASGVLPTDRRHAIKLFTNYRFTGGDTPWRRWTHGLNIGGSWNILSGSPISRFLAHPAYLNSGEIPVGGRGSLGRTDWTWPIDLHADYTIRLRENLALKIVGDMFNALNQKRVLRVDQNAELRPGTPNPDFLKPNTLDFAQPYQTPRYTRIALRLEF